MSLHGKFFPLGDTPTQEELASLRTSIWRALRGTATGEFREPKAGEWYLSGAVVHAYKAPNDLSSKYWIAQLCGTRSLEIECLVP